MREKKEGQVVINDIEPKILKLMISWIYMGKIEVQELQDKIDLFKAAHQYQLESLRRWCTLQICGRFSVENALDMYQLGVTYAEPLFLQNALRIIKSKRRKVFEDEKTVQEIANKCPKLMLDLLNFDN